MKKLFALTAILALVLAGCDDGSKDDGNGGTTLTIVNSSDYGNLHITFGSIEFRGIGRGNEVTKKVTAGTRYVNIIYDLATYGDCLFLTNEAITCEENKPNQFIITNNTVVTILNGYVGMQNTTGTFKTVVQDLSSWAASNQ